MKTDLQKRLEEAAKKYINENLPADMPSITYETTEQDFKAGAKLGYKEAIADMEKWLIENARYYVPSAISRQALRIDFECYMNKLWEENK